MAAKGFILGDGTRQIEARVYNRGQEASSTLTFTATGASLDNTSYVNAQILPDQLDTLLINLPAGTDLYPGNIVNVTLAQVNGNDDVYAANNSSDATFNYHRILLLEEFTTEKCPNCPGAAEKIHNLLYGPDNLERQVAVVCHHAGYNTDGFTTSTDLAYEWFYNNEGSTYAPALMYNRTPQTTTSEGTSTGLNALECQILTKAQWILPVFVGPSTQGRCHFLRKHLGSATRYEDMLAVVLVHSQYE